MIHSLLMEQTGVTVRSYIAGVPFANIVEVREVDATLVELKSAQDRAMAIVKELGVRAVS